MAIDWTPIIDENQVEYYNLQTPDQYLLDLYPKDSYQGYSLRRLRAAQTLCIRVRRDNDDAVQDIGFVGEDLDTASLLAFVGSNSGYIVAWYDQSGASGRDLQQASPSLQPRIVNAGSLETDSNGNTAAYFKAGDTLSGTGQVATGAGARCTIQFSDLSGAATQNFTYEIGQGSTGNRWLHLYANEKRYQLGFSGSNAYTLNTAPRALLFTGQFPSSSLLTSSAKIYVGNQPATAGYTNPSNPIDTTGLNLTTFRSRDRACYHSELLTYSADKASELTDIQNNCLGYWDQGTPDTPLLDQFPGAELAFSLRRLRAAQTLCMRIRRASDDQETDIGFIYNIIDAQAILDFAQGSVCYVRTWYDQSTNNQHIENSDPAGQPLIFDGNSIYVSPDNNPGVYATSGAVGQVLTFVETKTLAAVTAFSLHSYTGVERARPWRLNGSTVGNENVGLNWPQAVSTRLPRVFFANNPNVNFTGTISQGAKFMTLYLGANQNTLRVWENDVEQTPDGPLGNNPLTLGNGLAMPLANAQRDDYITEAIFYPSDQLTNRAAISSNMQTFWNT